MLIYKCNFPNGKYYIGQTKRKFEIRKLEHKKEYNDMKSIRYNDPIYRAIRFYGWENLTWEIIDECDSLERLNLMETYWIVYYNTYIYNNDSNGYNCDFGGNSHAGYKVSPEVKTKISIGVSGENNGRAKLTNQNILEIIRLSKTGIKNSQIARMFNVKDSIIGKIVTGKRWNSITGII
jgi:group I intron endonuclease